jgi:hypothetical protein
MTEFKDLLQKYLTEVVDDATEIESESNYQDGYDYDNNSRTDFEFRLLLQKSKLNLS